MRLRKNKSFWISGSLAALIFILLFMGRLDLFEILFNRPKTLSFSAGNTPNDKETWMNIFQGNRKIGFSHARLSSENDGYQLEETVRMRINTMGMVQDVHLKTRGGLKADFSLADFDFKIDSGRFSFSVKGSVFNDVLTVQTAGIATGRKIDIKLKTKPYLLAAITTAVATAELYPGDKYTFDIFDPATLGQSPVIIEVIGDEDLHIAGEKKTATKVVLNFRGSNQIAWIGESGDVLRELGILGIRLEKTSGNIARQGLTTQSSADLTQIASVASNVVLENLDRRSALKVEISGIPFEGIRLNGGRQTFINNVLTVSKESMVNLAADIGQSNLQTFEKIFLKSTPFIQSDHQTIRALAKKIIGNHSRPLEKVHKLVEWVYQNIEKRPVISLPDALSTLENRVGDCNEHAVLMAALARAAGIPCRVEAGLVYLKGRFYYHAWNLVYIGRWITVDALFDQIPADVSHIRFVTGSPDRQLDLMGIIGNVRLRIID